MSGSEFARAVDKRIPELLIELKVVLITNRTNG